MIGKDRLILKMTPTEFWGVGLVHIYPFWLTPVFTCIAKALKLRCTASKYGT
ncbi:hypothetical protein [Acinetobacter baumannii]|uniref:hypothetical protein n=1 Tax=Acinetobacter baumannii TaxID=470 RepID=UPI000A71F62A|nr:hypothetical protein [Acinetobacter baumannii]